MLDLHRLESRQQGGSPFAAPLAAARTALLGPPAWLERNILAALALFVLSCVGSIVVLFLARRRARDNDFFIFRLRNKYVVSSTAMSWLAFNIPACAILAAYSAVLYAALHSVPKRIQLEPYAWLGCIFTAPWTAIWFSFCGSLYGLIVAPSEHLEKSRGFLLTRLLRPALFNAACIGAPLALIAVSVPLGIQLSKPATAVYRKILLVEPMLARLDAEYEAGGFAALNLTEAAEAQRLGQGISGQYGAVTARWRYCWCFWLTWLAISLLLFIPVFVVLTRRLRGVRTGRTSLPRPPTNYPSPVKDDTEVPKLKSLGASSSTTASISSPTAVTFPSWSPQIIVSSPTLDKWTDEARSHARRSLLRTVAHSAAMLAGLATYAGLLAWMLTIDPIQASATVSGIAHLISLYAYAIPSLIGTALIGARLLSHAPHLSPEVTRSGSIAAASFPPMTTPITPDSPVSVLYRRGPPPLPAALEV